MHIFLLLLSFLVTAAHSGHSLNKRATSSGEEGDGQLINIHKNSFNAARFKDVAVDELGKSCCEHLAPYPDGCCHNIKLFDIIVTGDLNERDLKGIYRLNCCEKDPSGKKTIGKDNCCAQETTVGTSPSFHSSASPAPSSSPAPSTTDSASMDGIGMLLLCICLMVQYVIN